MSFPYYTACKPAYTLFMIQLYSGFMIIGWILYREAKKAPPIQRKQLLSLFWGTSLGFLGGQTTVPLVYGIKLFPYGVFFCPLYVLSVGYAMLRYQFMDFKLALRKLGLTVGIYTCLFLITLPLTWPFLLEILKYPSEILSQVFVVIILFTFILAAGPVIYAFFLNRSFWLRSHSSMGLTHELKSPLANIRGAIEYLGDQLRGLQQVDSQLTDYTDIIKRNTTRLECYVDDLLNIAAIQEGNISLEMTSFSLAEVINETIETHRPLADQKKIQFKFLNEPVPPINGDREKIRQTISNLISNALKFSDGGTIRINLSRQSGDISCSVSDQGSGISRKNLDKIFDRFYQAEKGRTMKGSGTGLGYLSRKRGWRHIGGRFGQSRRGKGKGRP